MRVRSSEISTYNSNPAHEVSNDDKVVDYLAGQLKRAVFPCTSKEADIQVPQHPGARIDGAQHVGISTFLVLMAVFLEVRPSCAHAYTHLEQARRSFCNYRRAWPTQAHIDGSSRQSQYAKHYDPYLGMGYSF
jgi:hypothetical protein